jgi:hypothetical protein
VGQFFLSGEMLWLCKEGFITEFFPNSQPKKFIEVFSGGGTGQEVTKELGIKNLLIKRMIKLNWKVT